MLFNADGLFIERVLKTCRHILHAWYFKKLRTPYTRGSIRHSNQQCKRRLHWLLQLSLYIGVQTNSESLENSDTSSLRMVIFLVWIPHATYYLICFLTRALGSNRDVVLLRCSCCFVILALLQMFFVFVSFARLGQIATARAYVWISTAELGLYLAILSRSSCRN